MAEVGDATDVVDDLVEEVTDADAAFCTCYEHRTADVDDMLWTS